MGWRRISNEKGWGKISHANKVGWGYPMKCGAGRGYQWKGGCTEDIHEKGVWAEDTLCKGGRAGDIPWKEVWGKDDLESCLLSWRIDFQEIPPLMYLIKYLLFQSQFRDKLFTEFISLHWGCLVQRKHTSLPKHIHGIVNQFSIFRHKN